ncbi:hypothetical protein MycrhDRAFT_5682 [Mycolicibacterium rhodesiae JS60]|nr:hypothetical protein MycrhDRAFT_5682 [Mycolicibacterium rhodesiae JS60]
MSAAEVVFHEPGGDVETRHERALRRAAQLQSAFQSVFEVLAEIYRDEDWRYINDTTGHPYAGFTAFVQDQLGCAASYARRYQQGIVGLVLPLQQVALPGARIPVTSSDVARLGVAGARVVVEEAPSVLEGMATSEDQTEALRELIDSVAKRSTDPGFGPVRESALPPSPLGSLVPAEVPDELPASSPVDTAPPSSAPVSWTATASFASPAGDSPAGDDDVDQEQPGDTAPDSAPSAGVPPLSALPPPAPTSHDDTSPSLVATAGAGELADGLDDDMAAFEAAITAVLAAGDPTALAERLSRGAGASLAPKCLASGQRLVRLGQLLRSLS